MTIPGKDAVPIADGYDAPPHSGAEDRPRLYRVTRVIWDGRKCVHEHTNFNTRKDADNYADRIRNGNGDECVTVAPIYASRAVRERRFRERQQSLAKDWPLQVRKLTD
jgi:hypothetical protein